MFRGIKFNSCYFQDATSVYLDGNELGHVDTQSFIGRRRITSLYMNSSHVKSVSKESFSGLNSLTSLHLEDNSIKELHGHEFSDLPALRELYLQVKQKSNRLKNHFWRELKMV